MRRSVFAAWVCFLAFAGAGPAGAQSGEGSLTLFVEPGVVTGPGEALVPFRFQDRQGRVFTARTGEVALEIEGRAPSRPPGLVSFGSEEPYELTVLVDPSAFRGLDPAPWIEELASLWGSAHPGERRTLLGLERRLRTWAEAGEPVDREHLAERLSETSEVALWDGVLLGLDHASHAGPPARRVLLVIANGREGKESRHPVATCGDAADSARVSIWCVTPGAPQEAGVGVQRLQTLTGRTGGATLVAEPGRGADALREALARIRGSQALRVSGIDGLPPFSIEVRPGVAASRPVTSSIRTRRPLGLRAGSDLPWIPLGIGLVVALAGGFLAARRFVPIGTLRIRSGDGESVRVTRGGITIGGARGNGLVLADSRISRNHAAIRMEEGRVVLVDLRSSNGTRVNGRRVRSAELETGDRIVLADAVELEWRAGFRFGS